MPKTKTTNSQIVSRERVRDLAEVFTNQREVDAMLDTVADMFPTGPEDLAELATKRFLEPAVGRGVFVLEILRRKLKHLHLADCGDLDTFQVNMLLAVGSIYAVDIDESNVRVTRDGLLDVLVEHWAAETGQPGSEMDPGYRASVLTVLTSNIQLGNTLTDMDKLLWVCYQVRPDAEHAWVIRRSWSVAGSDEVVMRDPIGERGRVYYAKLHQAPAPVRVEREKEEVAA